MDLKSENPSLIEYINQAKVVLFLGSGASYDCTNPSHPKKKLPLGNSLRDELSDKFLGGKFRDSSLSEVAEYAISESSIPEVQQYVKELFDGFEPSAAHKILPTIPWAGLATTNYDLFIEGAYVASGNPLQKLKPIIDSCDDIVTLLKPNNSVAYLKLHGCFSRLGPKDLPLVLSNDQYANYIKGRENLFDTLKEWAGNFAFVFAGYSGQDQNIRSFVTQLIENQEYRPRYYFVKPKFDPIEAKFWTSRRITPIELTFSNFIEKVDQALSGVFRGLVIETLAPTGLSRYFHHDALTLSANASVFVTKDCDFVLDIEPGKDANPSDFYRGSSKGWQWCIQDFDMDRDIVDELITEFILIDDRTRPVSDQIVLLHGYAGSGKTVSLKRIAWEAAKSYDLLSFYLRPEGKLNAGAIQEIVDACKQRVFIFIDDACNHAYALKKFMKELGDYANMVTLVLAARTNEWNESEARSGFNIARRFELGNLAHYEIGRLLTKLTEHNSLFELSKLSPEDRFSAFKDRAGRNLLVALHEATHGKPFEEIIVDEYNRIESEQARSLYLTICVLNRLGVGVRAGLISRLHGITFDRFQKDFFAPLEQVVFAARDPLMRDMVYTARHEYIAEIIFNRILSDQNSKFEYYSRVVGYLNLGYSSDERAFREMTRGRVLNQMFTDSSLVDEIYKIASDKASENAYLKHQRGVFEMNRNGGNLNLASELLEAAASLQPWNGTVKHSLSELALKRADKARTPLEREHYLREAQRRAQTVAQSGNRTSHSSHTLAKVALSRLEMALGDEEMFDSPSLQGLVKSAEDAVTASLLQFPGDPYLLESKSRLASLLNEKPRAIEALEKAFKANNKISYLALQLFNCYQEIKEYAKAEKILIEALEAKRGDWKLNYAYGVFLMDQNRMPEDSTYYLRRAFSPGDKNYDAHIRYGRELFRGGQYSEAEAFFTGNHGKSFVSGFAGSVMHPLETRREGVVTQVGKSFLRVRDGISKIVIFAKREGTADDVWDRLVEGSSISFLTGFNLLGPIGFDVSLTN